MKNILLFLMLCVSISCLAQNEDTINHPPSVVLSNGTNVNISYNTNKNVLSVEIRNNPDEVEIIVAKNGATIGYDISDLEDDNIDIDLSDNKNETVDIYIRNRKESQYLGKVSCK